MFEAYKVAVKLSLINNVSSGLVMLAGQFQALDKSISSTRRKVGDLEADLLKLKRLGLVGGAMAAAGGFGLSLFKGPLDEAKQFQTEVARFTSLGFGEKVNRDAVEFAKGMKTYGTSALDNMTLVSDAMAVFKNLHHAEMAAPIMAKMKFANEAVFGEAGKANESKFMDMLKVIEFRRGLSSMQEFDSQANYVQKVISGSRNRVDSTQLLQALKTGGVALSQRSNEAFYLGSEPLIQEFGGSRYGTAAMSIYQNLVQSRGTITAQQELYRLGLLKKDMVQFNSLGMLKKALPGAFVGSEVLEKEGELALLEKVLLPAFRAKGITDEEGIIRELGMILGNRTGSGLMSRIYQQRETLKMQTEANKSAQDINALDQTGRKTLGGAELELHKKWRDVLNTLGTTVLPLAIKGVEWLTNVAKGVVAFAREFPTLTKGMVIGFAVLSGIVATGGVLALATSGFKALGLVLGAGGAGSGMGAMLTAAAVGLSKVFAVSAAFAGGYVAGTLINDHLINPAVQKLTGDKDQTLGGWIYDITHRDKEENKGARFVQGKIRQPVQVTVVSKLNDREIARAVTTVQDKEGRRPPTGGSSFDGSMAPRPVGAGATGGW